MFEATPELPTLQKLLWPTGGLVVTQAFVSDHISDKLPSSGNPLPLRLKLKVDGHLRPQIHDVELKFVKNGDFRIFQSPAGASGLEFQMLTFDSSEGTVILESKTPQPRILKVDHSQNLQSFRHGHFVIPRKTMATLFPGFLLPMEVSLRIQTDGVLSKGFVSAKVCHLDVRDQRIYAVMANGSSVTAKCKKEMKWLVGWRLQKRRESDLDQFLVACLKSGKDDKSLKGSESEPGHKHQKGEPLSLDPISDQTVCKGVKVAEMREDHRAPSSSHLLLPSDRAVAPLGGSKRKIASANANCSEVKTSHGPVTGSAAIIGNLKRKSCLTEGREQLPSELSVICNGVCGIMTTSDWKIRCMCNRCEQLLSFHQTPQMWERHCGRSASKSWKRSIRVQGITEGGSEDGTIPGFSSTSKPLTIGAWLKARHVEVNFVVPGKGEMLHQAKHLHAAGVRPPLAGIWLSEKSSSSLHEASRGQNLSLPQQKTVITCQSCEALLLGGHNSTAIFALCQCPDCSSQIQSHRTWTLEEFYGHCTGDWGWRFGSKTVMHLMSSHIKVKVDGLNHQDFPSLAEWLRQSLLSDTAGWRDSKGKTVYVYWWDDVNPDTDGQLGVWYEATVIAVDQEAGQIKLRYKADSSEDTVIPCINFISFSPPTRTGQKQPHPSLATSVGVPLSMDTSSIIKPCCSSDAGQCEARRCLKSLPHSCPNNPSKSCCLKDPPCLNDPPHHQDPPHYKDPPCLKDPPRHTFQKDPPLSLFYQLLQDLTTDGSGDWDDVIGPLPQSINVNRCRAALMALAELEGPSLNETKNVVGHLRCCITSLRPICETGRVSQALAQLAQGNSQQLSRLWIMACFLREHARRFLGTELQQYQLSSSEQQSNKEQRLLKSVALIWALCCSWDVTHEGTNLSQP